MTTDTTGDLKNSILKLVREARRMKLNVNLDADGLINGSIQSHLQLLSQAVNSYSLELTKYLHEKGYDLYGKNDSRFLEILYKSLRDEFAYRTKLTRQQFLTESAFTERKILFTLDVLKLCQEKHRELARVTHKNKLTSVTAQSNFKNKTNIIRPNLRNFDKILTKYNPTLNYSLHTDRADKFVSQDTIYSNSNSSNLLPVIGNSIPLQFDNASSIEDIHPIMPSSPKTEHISNELINSPPRPTPIPCVFSPIDISTDKDLDVTPMQTPEKISSLHHRPKMVEFKKGVKRIRFNLDPIPDSQMESDDDVITSESPLINATSTLRPTLHTTSNNSSINEILDNITEAKLEMDKLSKSVNNRDVNALHAYNPTHKLMADSQSIQQATETTTKEYPLSISEKQNSSDQLNYFDKFSSNIIASIEKPISSLSNIVEQMSARLSLLETKVKEVETKSPINNAEFTPQMQNETSSNMTSPKMSIYDPKKYTDATNNSQAIRNSIVRRSKSLIDSNPIASIDVTKNRTISNSLSTNSLTSLCLSPPHSTPSIPPLPTSIFKSPLLHNKDNITYKNHLEKIYSSLEDLQHNFANNNNNNNNNSNISIESNDTNLLNSPPTREDDLESVIYNLRKRAEQARDMLQNATSTRKRLRYKC